MSLAPDTKDATDLATALKPGEPQAADQLLELVYEELRNLAAYNMAKEAPGQTLQPTALVHEAWIRLTSGHHITFNNRTHFLRTASEAMRRILIDRARRKSTQRHGGGYERVDDVDIAAPDVDAKLLSINEALDNFAVEYPIQAELVKLRYFVGMTNEEASEVLEISVSSAKNYWKFARAWLLNKMGDA